MTKRWLVLAVPVLMASLLAQLACGDDGGGDTGTGGDEDVDAASTFDSGTPDATLPDSSLPDTSAPDSTTSDVSTPDSTVTDANVVDAADAGGPICTRSPTFFDAGAPYFSFDVDVAAPAGTCAIKPSVQPDDSSVKMVINFDPGSPTFNIFVGGEYEMVSTSAVKTSADGGLVPFDAGAATGNVFATDATITLVFRRNAFDAGPDSGDAGGALYRTMVFRMNSAASSANWTLTLFSFN